jgi:hypothetical protein
MITQPPVPLMAQRVYAVAFEGIEARGVDVQVQVAPGPLAHFLMLPSVTLSN